MENFKYAFDNPVEFIEGILNSLPVFVIVINKEGTVVYSNKLLTEFLSESPNGNNYKKYFDNDEIFREKLENSTLTYEIEYKEYFYKITDLDIIWANKENVRLITFLDITEAKNLNSKFIKNITMDPMTGINNRQVGVESLNRYILAVRSVEDTFTIAYIDLNDLKYINDTYGHSAGDLYINSVVNIVKSTIRQTDIFSRMGGDEFLIIFPKCRYDIVDNIMQTVTKKLELVNNTHTNEDVVYSISYGIMEVTSETKSDFEYILNTVDAKMYYMKEEYKNQKKMKKMNSE